MSEEEKAERRRLRAAGLPIPKKEKVVAPKKAAPKKHPPVAKRHVAEPPPEVPDDIAADAADANLSPLDYMLKVMRDSSADRARRDRMAIAAAPFVHARREPVGQGKKDAAAQAADKANGGRFGSRPPPLKVVSGG